MQLIDILQRLKNTISLSLPNFKAQRLKQTVSLTTPFKAQILEAVGNIVLNIQVAAGMHGHMHMTI